MNILRKLQFSGELGKRGNMAVRLLIAIAVLVSFLVGGSSSAAERNRIVFISDLHMNVDADYSWLKENTGPLAQFLNNLYIREDVAELVILGDLLDDWVCPVEDIPNTFKRILDADHNKGIVQALRALCENDLIKVTYVVGNHDMLSWMDDNRGLIQSYFPSLNIISNDPGMGHYTIDNVVWTEHGHRYTMFNAPDIWSKPGSHLPLGYFISRLAASSSLTTGQVVTTYELLDQYVKSPSTATGYGLRGDLGGIWDDAFIIAVFNGIALGTGHRPWTHFLMNQLDAYNSDPTVEGVAFTFDSIVSDWPTNHNRVSSTMAIWDDLGHLSGPANIIFEMPDYLKPYYDFTPRIILFGHTHQPEFKYHSGQVDTIYVNTGTWIDSTKKTKHYMTWAEIEMNDLGNGQKSYQVELWYLGESSPRHSGRITATVN
jgi:UDP-2,3-diacylglucosamine pyrophosphatase LpxH